MLAWAAWVYNRLVRLRNEIANAFAQIAVQLQRRHDPAPNLVEVVRKSLQHGRETLEAVTAVRNTARAAADRAQQPPADPGLIGALAAADGVLGSARVPDPGTYWRSL